MLVAYLIEERRLIEFVLGPSMRTVDGALF